MIQKLTKIFVIMLITISAYSQNNLLTVEKIEQNSISFNWGDIDKNNAALEYGLTKELESGKIKGLTLSNLKDATFYYVKAKTNSADNIQESTTQLFTTASKSSGDITVYFNRWVDNNASSVADAIQVTAFEDTIISYINHAQNTLDVCNYNTGSLPIITAINNAEASGITIRYIAADNTGTNNDELSNLSSTISMIQRPDDGEVMHNKFLIIDAADPVTATVVTGSVNHTDNSCHNDYNNMVIIEDQSLALAYETEFEEMWGSTGDTPNISNAKFGNAKTDNTPHNFNIGGIPVELYFSPSDGTTAHIESSVLSADTDMQFSMLTFINNDLGDAVISLHNSGVDVKGIIENIYYFGSEYNGLESAGVDVHSHFTEAEILHHKYGIIDAGNISSDPLVITGSHNWTNSAENDYDENTLIIHDAEIANMYYEEFMARYAEITDAAGIDENKLIESINIYPNPANDVLNIKSESIIENIAIRNYIGQLVERENKIQSKLYKFDLSYLSCGIYYVTIVTQVETITFKIIKE